MTGLPDLSGADWLVRAETQRVLRALLAAGHEAQVVGGAVRNALIGMPVSDIDIATPATPDEVVAAVTAAGLHAVPTGLQHGTVTVIADHVPHEVTTLRRDVATDGRHATVAFTRDWAADAARRDFTMNALYCDAEGRVHDPLGGYPDLAARRVRFIGSADARIAEDYLRILRFFRFAAQYACGPLDAEGLAACVRGRHGLAGLSAERIRAELVKLLVAPGALRAIAAMFDHGLLTMVLGAAPRLQVLQRMTEIEAGTGASPSAARRLGALTLHTDGDAARLARRLRLTRAEAATLASATRPHARLIEATLTERDARVLLHALGAGQWRDSVMLRWAWSGEGADDRRWQHLLTLPQRKPIPAFPIKGADLLQLGFAPGPVIGDLMRRLEADWIAADFSSDRETLLAQALTGKRSAD